MSGRDTANSVREMEDEEEEDEDKEEEVEEEGGGVWGEEFHCWRRQQPCSTLINSMI